jgi:hypothetical protein
MSTSTQRSIESYLARRRAAADRVRQASVPGHEVTAEKDWAKAFASRPGSDDWKAHCTCGWASSGWHHGEVEALASADRHLRAEKRADK